jgi:hypothetical protein
MLAIDSLEILQLPMPLGAPRDEAATQQPNLPNKEFTMSTCEMTFMNQTDKRVQFTVNWNAVHVGSVTVDAGQNGSVSDELVTYHIKAADAATGQFLAEDNGVWGNAQVLLTWSEVTGYKLSPNS